MKAWAAQWRRSLFADHEVRISNRSSRGHVRQQGRDFFFASAVQAQAFIAIPRPETWRGSQSADDNLLFM